MWLATFSALTAITSLCCFLGCLFVARNAAARSASLRKRIDSCESTVQSVTSSLREWQEVVADLANQIKMTKVRKALNHSGNGTRPGGEPDPKVDPEAWRTWKNAQLRAGVFNQ